MIPYHPFPFECPAVDHNPDLFDGGQQWVFKFNNGYTVSVVRHQYSYGYEKGLWEAGLLGEHGVIDDPVTGADVTGYLTEKEVALYLTAVAHYDHKE